VLGGDDEQLPGRGEGEERRLRVLDPDRLAHLLEDRLPRRRERGACDHRDRRHRPS